MCRYSAERPAAQVRDEVVGEHPGLAHGVLGVGRALGAGLFGGEVGHGRRVAGRPDAVLAPPPAGRRRRAAGRVRSSGRPVAARTGRGFDARGPHHGPGGQPVAVGEHGDPVLAGLQPGVQPDVDVAAAQLAQRVPAHGPRRPRAGCGRSPRRAPTSGPRRGCCGSSARRSGPCSPARRAPRRRRSRRRRRRRSGRPRGPRRRGWTEAMSSCSSTWLRSPMASSTVLKPMPYSARPGTGRVRETEPGARTSSSYGMSSVPAPSSWVARVATVTIRRSVVDAVASPTTIRHLPSTRRSGTTTCRGRDRAGRGLRQEGLVGHVRLRIDDGDLGLLALQLPLEPQGGIHPDIATADDENARCACRGHGSRLRRHCSMTQWIRAVCPQGGQDDSWGIGRVPGQRVRR